jgi:hypothetical protein
LQHTLGARSTSLTGGFKTGSCGRFVSDNELEIGDGDRRWARSFGHSNEPTFQKKLMGWHWRLYNLRAKAKTMERYEERSVFPFLADNLFGFISLPWHTLCIP